MTDPAWCYENAAEAAALLDERYARILLLEAAMRPFADAAARDRASVRHHKIAPRASDESVGVVVNHADLEATLKVLGRDD
jgi:hypothetical protein